MKCCEFTRQLSLPAVECKAEPQGGGKGAADSGQCPPADVCERDCLQGSLPYGLFCLTLQNRGGHRVLKVTDFKGNSDHKADA